MWRDPELVRALWAPGPVREGNAEAGTVERGENGEGGVL